MLASVTSAADLAADTAVTPLGDGRYRLDLANHWDYLLPSGGVVLTAALRAGAAMLGDASLRLWSSTATFCAPVPAGRIDLVVTILRRGAATAQLRVDVHTGAGEIAVVVTATFGRDRVGPDVIGARMPIVGSVADSIDTADDDPRNPRGRFRFYHQVDCRIADGDRFWTDDHAAGPPRYARWFRYRAPQRDTAGQLDRLALPPLLDTMPTALQRAIGPGDYRFYAPSLDLTMHVVDDTDREWLLLSSYVRRARAGIAIGEIEAWDDRGRLIAFATQAMYLKTLSGTPPVIDASRR